MPDEGETEQGQGGNNGEKNEGAVLEALTAPDLDLLQYPVGYEVQGDRNERVVKGLHADSLFINRSADK